MFSGGRNCLSTMFKFEKRKIQGILVILFFIIAVQCYRLYRTLEIGEIDVGRIRGEDSNDNETGSTELRHSDNMLILVWKYGESLENRHIHHFDPIKRFSPWDNCSASCDLTYNQNDSDKADAVLFHLQRMTQQDAQIISKWSQENRKKGQIWIFLTDESPVHTFLWPEYNGIFNWSMTYRSDSDVYVPYGRTVKRVQNEIKIPKKEKLAAVMGSHCVISQISLRWLYVKELLKLLEGRRHLDVFGRCLNGNRTVCLGHFKRDCPFLSNYKFYLAFENSNCPEYLTEKVFWNAYEKFAVPIIMGAPKKDCERLLPPNSFLHVDDFASPRDLADYLEYLDLNDEKYGDFHAWRRRFAVLNEHGYFGSTPRHYCRLCEALHSNISREKYYEDLSDYWSPKDCVLQSFSKL